MEHNHWHRKARSLLVSHPHYQRRIHFRTGAFVREFHLLRKSSSMDPMAPSFLCHKLMDRLRYYRARPPLEAHRRSRRIRPETCRLDRRSHDFSIWIRPRSLLNILTMASSRLLSI